MGGRSVRGREIGGIVLAGLASAAIASTLFGRREGVDPRLLVLAMVATFALGPTRRLIAALPLDHRQAPPLRTVVGPTDGTAVPPGLTRWIGRVNGGTASARAATIRLVPDLRELTRLRLADRTGISLDHAPAEAASILGPRVWSIVDPDAARSIEADRPGLSLDDVEELTAALERL
jgi:hypothetical protein